uniref:Methyltransferase domain-containing protein n=1 Tax=viral metagenome TaxID=1070528 RepID=A0A6C0DWQ1_9ZZZZ
MNTIKQFKIVKLINESYNDFIRLSLLHKLFLILLIIVFYLLLNNHTNIYENYEDMTSGNKFESKYDDAIYDAFYAKYYDALHGNKECAIEQLKIIVYYAKNIKFVKLLDIGCGTGYHVHMLTKMKYDVTGLDKSRAMIEKAKMKYKNSSFVVGDFLQNNLFDYNSFTHLICLNKTFYCFIDKRLFFEKSHLLLNADGILIIHILNRSSFKPYVVSKNDNTVVYNSENDIDKKTPLISIVKINKTLEYISEYNVLNTNNEDINNEEESPFSCYNEKFINVNTNTVRKHTINLYIPTIDEIIEMAKAKGFIVKDQKPLKTLGINSEFLLILKKNL